MNDEQIINWLLQGDVSIQYQVYHDLLKEDRPDLKARIEHEGWGKKLVSKRHEDGHWGRGFYQPKWISSHYSLLDLRNLNIPSNNLIIQSLDQIIKNERGTDNGINPHNTLRESDVCINGMFLEYGSYFGLEEEKLKDVINFILSQKMPDGGFNCQLNRSGAKHSSLHTTIAVLEGIATYSKKNYTYKLDELQEVENSSREFILQHQLFISDKSGEIISKNFLKLSYPSRWRYDILRALDYFQFSKTEFDERMRPAILVLLKKRKKDGRWPVQAKHPGQTHFDMEKTGGPSRWNTLRALRVLKYYNLD